jgi:hypothetical protein
MSGSNLDALERLFELKSKSIITEEEFERKKSELLRAGLQTSYDSVATTVVLDRMLGHGVPLVVGGVILLLITIGLLSDDKSAEEDLKTALGTIFVFGLWLIPHSIWLITKRGANIILPIVALVLVGCCSLAYVGSL